MSAMKRANFAALFVPACDSRQQVEMAQFSQIFNATFNGDNTTNNEHNFTLIGLDGRDMCTYNWSNKNTLAAMASRRICNRQFQFDFALQATTQV